MTIDRASYRGVFLGSNVRFDPDLSNEKVWEITITNHKNKVLATLEVRGQIRYIKNTNEKDRFVWIL